MWQFWLIVSGIFFIGEIITIGFLLFWFAIGALLAMISSFFTDNLIIQTSIFVISSGLLLFFTKTFFTNLKIFGSEVWSAKSLDNTPIPKGTKITVFDIDGVKAIVSTKATTTV